ncbi:MAG: hypothetical protein U0414_03210 [Polyangiaceae bacterium]
MDPRAIVQILAGSAALIGAVLLFLARIGPAERSILTSREASIQRARNATLGNARGAWVAVRGRLVACADGSFVAPLSGRAALWCRTRVLVYSPLDDDGSFVERHVETATRPSQLSDGAANTELDLGTATIVGVDDVVVELRDGDAWPTRVRAIVDAHPDRWPLLPKHVQVIETALGPGDEVTVVGRLSKRGTRVGADDAHPEWFVSPLEARQMLEHIRRPTRLLRRLSLVGGALLLLAGAALTTAVVWR